LQQLLELGHNLNHKSSFIYLLTLILLHKVEIQEQNANYLNAAMKSKWRKCHPMQLILCK